MRTKINQFISFIRLHIFEIFYYILLIILSKYITTNWEKCISMKFFEEFNGNNILFLVWIALLILTFYDVEAEGWKFHRKKPEDLRRSYDVAEANYTQNQINNIMDNSQFQNENSNDRGDNL